MILYLASTIWPQWEVETIITWRVTARFCLTIKYPLLGIGEKLRNTACRNQALPNKPALLPWKYFLFIPQIGMRHRIQEHLKEHTHHCVQHSLILAITHRLLESALMSCSQTLWFLEVTGKRINSCSRLAPSHIKPFLIRRSATNLKMFPTSFFNHLEVTKKVVVVQPCSLSITSTQKMHSKLF